MASIDIAVRYPMAYSGGFVHHLIDHPQPMDGAVGDESSPVSGGAVENSMKRVSTLKGFRAYVGRWSAQHR
jgi:hypothetical protein